MAELNPAPWLQNSGATNSAQLMRLGVGSVSAGVTSNVTPRGGVHPSLGGAMAVSAGAGLTVNVAAGVVYIPGTTDSAQGVYVCTNTGTVNLALTAADGASNRTDLIVARVEDHFYDSGGVNQWSLEVVDGTPGSSSPNTPAFDTYVALAEVVVPAGSSVPGTITQVRPTFVAAGGIMPVRTVSELPSAGRYEGMYADQWDEDALKRWNGASWDTIASLAGFSLSQTAVVLQTTDISSTSTANAFTSIPSTYRHLAVMWHGNHNSGVNEFTSLNMRFNSDGGTDQYASQRIAFGTDSGTFTNGEAISNWGLFTVMRVGAVGNTLANSGIVFINHYASGVAGQISAFGIGICRRSSGGTIAMGGGYYVGSGPVTSIALWPSGTTWSSSFCRATLLAFEE